MFSVSPLLEKYEKYDTSKYKDLDDHGFAKENTYVTADDVIMAKCFKHVLDNGKTVTKVRGDQIVKFGTGYS